MSSDKATDGVKKLTLHRWVTAVEFEAGQTASGRIHIALCQGFPPRSLYCWMLRHSGGVVENYGYEESAEEAVAATLHAIERADVWLSPDDAEDLAVAVQGLRIDFGG